MSLFDQAWDYYQHVLKHSPTPAFTPAPRSTSNPWQRGQLIYKLTDLIWQAQGEPGAWERGVIQPSQLELDRYSDARAEARDYAGQILTLLERSGWTPPRS